MSNIRDFTGKNRRFTGTIGEEISRGTTAERDTAFGNGTLRFNTTTNLMEYYDGTQWKAIDAPPVITGFTVDGGSAVTSATIDNEKGGNFTFEINGSLFDTTGASVAFIGSGETVSTNSITRDNANLITCTVLASDFDATNSPYTIRVTNGSGLSANLADAISADQSAPSFTNAADTIYSIYDSVRGSVSISASDLCGASGGSGFTVSSGSLPSGLTMNSADGSISGSTSAVGSDTTATFTVSATGDEATGTRQFKITQKAPVVQSFTSTGSTTFSVPTGITAVDVLVVAGGGGGGNSTGHESGGGGGAGGYIYTPGHPVSPGSSVPVTVGAGGPGLPDASYSPPSSFNRAPHKGGNSSFGGGTTITATGGGAGGGQYYSGSPGGSGGGQSGNYNVNSVGSGTGGQGNPGGNGFNNGIASCAGGGGGAGASGGNAGSSNAGPGGSGTSSSISGSSVTYAGGGGGAAGNDGTGSAGSGGSGGGGNGGTNGSPSSSGTNNRGGGAGGAVGSGAGAGTGGSGIVIVSY